MRILLVADIHANRAALDAIAEPHDVCLALGDLVEYGPEPVATLEWLQQHQAIGVRGNHDHGCVQDCDITGVSGFRYLTMATRRPTLAALSQEHRRYLAELPLTRMLTLDGLRILLVHATPRDPLEEYTPSEALAWANRLTHVQADIVCVGHTHHQFTLQVGKTAVINPGSVGMPRDGDPRVRYAIIENGEVQLKQVEYDIEETVRALDKADFAPQARSLLADIYRHGRPIAPSGNGHTSAPSCAQGHTPLMIPVNH